METVSILCTCVVLAMNHCTQILFWLKTCARSDRHVEQATVKMADSKLSEHAKITLCGAADRRNKSCGHGLTRVGQTNLQLRFYCLGFRG